jgi:hypothetical protein
VDPIGAGQPLRWIRVMLRASPGHPRYAVILLIGGHRTGTLARVDSALASELRWRVR